MSIKVVQKAVKLIVTVDPVSPVWLDGYGGLRGTHSGCICDFKMRLKCLSPNQRRLLTVVAPFVPSGPVDCLWYAARWAVTTQAFCQANCSLKGPQEVSVTHAITLPVVSIIPRKTRSRGRVAADEQHGDFERACSNCVVFPRLTCCNEAAASSRISSAQFRQGSCSSYWTRKQKNATTAELAATHFGEKKKKRLRLTALHLREIYLLCAALFISVRLSSQMWLQR